MNAETDPDIRLVKDALSSNEQALLGFKRILADLEWVASERHWKMHCATPVAGGRCNAVITSRTCREGHTTGAG